MVAKEELLKLKEKLLKSLAKGRRRTYFLDNLNKHVDLVKLSIAYGSDLLDDLLRGETLKVRFPKAENETYMKFLNMYKLDKKAEKEGKKLIYLGFPFLEGPQLRGPILLYPLELKINEKKGEVLISLSGEPKVNELLFVFLEKRLKRGLDEEGLSALSSVKGKAEEIIKRVAKILEDYIPLEFISTKVETFQPGSRLSLRGFAIIGPFDPFPKSILKDIDDLIKFEKLGLLELVLDKDLKELKNDVKDEKELAFPLPFDSSQEKAIVSFSYGSSRILIIRGPPGTGKSQTIVNAIAQEVHLGRNVLVTSRKKQALDVIKKRLDSLGIPSVYVWDVNKDRNNAYKDMLGFMKFDDEIGSPEELTSLNEELRELRNELNEVREALTKVREPGLSLLDLYLMASKEPPDPELMDLLLTFRYTELLKTLKSLSKVKDFLKWDYEKRKDWSEKSVYERDLAMKAIKLLSKLNLKPDEISKIDVDSLSREPILDMNNDLEHYDRVIGILNEIVKNGDLDSILKSYEYLRRLKSASRLSKILPKYKNMKKFVDMVLSKYGINEEELDELATLAELPLEDLNSALRYWKSKKVLRDLGIDGIVESNLESFRALKDMFELEGLDLKRAELSLEHFNELRYLDIAKEGMDQRALKLLKYIKVLSEEDIVASFAYSWISKIEKDPEVARSLGKLKTYMNDLKKMDELIKSLNEVAKRVVSSEMKVFEPELKESVEDAKRKGIRLPSFLRKRSYLAKTFKVWLLSPEAVSELFPLEEGLFDVLIVDEASQMRPELIVPSIYRAERLVVVGDDKQLPPEDWSSESLLDLVKGRFPENMLRNHYRSRHEELIAFSNYAFYDGEIVTAPDLRPSKSLVYVKVGGRWENNVNVEEAKKVVEIIKEILKEDPNKSIAIITFNHHQKKLIENMLIEETKKDDEFKSLYEKNLRLERNGVFEGLLLQNIENVQGDERDVVIFSLVHAPDRKGKVRLHFGNLNFPGGERRLNVAITRARERVYLVTSLEPEDLGEPKSVGVRLLQEYMRYVKAVSEGNYEKAKEVLKRVGEGKLIKVTTPLDETLARLLKGSKTNVGTSKYAVPVAYGDLAIESDASAFKFTDNCLDELIKIKSLEAKGWRYKRIWSAEWWRKRDLISEMLEGLRGKDDTESGR